MLQYTCFADMEDRDTAIRQAIELANDQDTILILGKGNEEFLIRRNGKVAYKGDRQVALDVIDELYEGGEEYEA